MTTTDSKGATQLLLKKYQDVVGRIVTIFRNPTTKKYSLEAKLFNPADGRLLSITCISFATRQECFDTARKGYKRQIYSLKRDFFRL